jgi:hypothetical protein
VHLESSIDDFVARLSASSDTIGFLYYTGHGCQVDYQGYLVPTNVDTQKKLQIKYNAFNINKMLEKFKGAGNRVNMLFLDACRDVPTGAKGGTKGLGQPATRPKGSLVVYATEAGEVANDNSRFINALITNISKSNQTIETMGSSISREVAKKSGYRQIPEVYVKLLPENFVLKRGGGGYVPPTPKPTPKPISTSKWMKNTGEKATWKKAKEICRAKGGRLPSIEELRKVVTDCGGTITTYGDKNWDSLTDKNKANKSYQSCYKAKGFTSYTYWSSTTVASDSSDAWLVYFYYGSDYWRDKTHEYYVRCVRGGQ